MIRKTSINQLVTSLVVACLACLATACEEYGNPLDPATMRDKPFEKSDPNKNKKEVPAGEPENQKSAQLEDYQRPSYPNGVRRNPFQPDPAFLIQQAEFETENARVKEPLEAFGLGQLRLAAILSGISVPKAMFIDPNGLGHFAKVGDRVGDGGFIISSIREGSVTLSSENADDESGALANQTQVLRLSEQIGNDEQQLSEEDRAALDRILNSSAGQNAIRQQLNERPAANTNNTPGSNGGL